MSTLQGKSQLTNFVRVSAPARLHLGFLDLNGATGRRFGSIGMAIDSHQTIVEAHYSESEASHDAPKHIQKKLKQLIDAFFSVFSKQIPLPKKHCKLVVKKLIPEHAGLGSGTQLALAVGTALCRLYNINAGNHVIATALDRGLRSGIGIATFNQGGFVVDGGLGPATIGALKGVELDRVRAYRVKFYVDLITSKPEQEKFFLGWFRRATEV